MSSNKKRGGASGAISDDQQVLLCCMPISRAVRNNEEVSIAQCLEKFLGQGVTLNALKQHVGERFTGGKSTPVFELELLSSAVDVHRMILKLVVLNRPSSQEIQIQQRYAMEVRSYEVEAGFYGHQDDSVRENRPCPARALTKMGVKLPNLLEVERGGVHASSQGVNGAAISFLMEDLRVTHPLHPESLSHKQTRSALDWLARMHARFWEAPKLFDEWAGSQLWECGSYWAIRSRMELASVDSDDGVAAKMQSSWVNTLRWLQKKNASVACLQGVKLLGCRLGACRRGLHRVLHGDPTAPINLAPVVYSQKQRGRRCQPQFQNQSRRHRTLLHGDYKAANMFFMKGEVVETSDSCAVCDFQFAGPGLGAVDVCYLLFPDARADYDDDESSLLDWYYERLGKHLVGMGKGDFIEDYSRAALELHYRLAQVDFLAYSVGKGWVASAARDSKLVTIANETLSKYDDGEVISMNSYDAAFKADLAQV